MLIGSQAPTNRFFSYFTPDEISRQLRALGFTDIEDHTAQDVIGKYLGESPDFEEDPLCQAHLRYPRADN